MFEIVIKQIKIKTNIGVTEKERRSKQLLYLSLSFKYNTKKSFDINNIDSLISYSEIIKFVKNYVKNSKFKTLEKLIIEIKIELEKKFKIKDLHVTIEKPEVAKKYKCSSISVSK